MKISRLQYYECDICATKVKKQNTVVQGGLRRCRSCYDTPQKTPNIRGFGTGRANSDTTTAVETPTVYSITAAGGITPSRSLSSEDTRKGHFSKANLPSRVVFGFHYYMKVVGSGGAITITASPQIVAGSKSDILVLEGTSESNTVTISHGSGVVLHSGHAFTLGDGDVLTLSNDGTNWVEMSRFYN